MEHPDAPAFDRDHDLVRFLMTEHAKLHIADMRSHIAAALVESGAAPVLAVPIFQGDDLFAFATYGKHRLGTKLDPDEIATLENLCDVAAQAYIHVENLRYRASSTRLQPA